MRNQKVMLTVLAFLLVPMSLFADTAEEEKGLEKLVPQFKEAWSTGDFEKYMEILHPENQLRKIYEDAGDEMKEKIRGAFTKTTKAWGAVCSSKIQEYDEQTKSFLVQITFMTKGKITAALGMKKDEDGKWLIHSMKLGGPEGGK